MTPLRSTMTEEAGAGIHTLGGGSSKVESTNKGLFSFSGRLGRLRFIAYFLMIQVVGLALGVLFAVLDNSEDGLVSLAQLIVAILTASVVVRRFHDINRSGWMWLVLWVPFLNLFWIIYLMIGRGTEGYNRFGPPPS